MQVIHLVGAGLSSITFATHLNELLPNRFYFRFYEARESIGGNCSDVKDANGFVWQEYGPHIFHTSNMKVWDFISRFSEWFDYKHRVQTKIGQSLVPLPISLATYEALGVPFNIIRNEVRRDQYKTNLSFLRDRFGYSVADEIIKDYSERQWKMDINDIPMEVVNRLIVRNDRSPFYFNDVIQKQPVGGFSNMMLNMLDRIHNVDIEHCRIENSLDVLSMLESDSLVIWTGHLDALYDGDEVLPWRNTEITNIRVSDKGFYQTSGTVNHASSNKGIRTSDYAHIANNQFFDSTMICIEDPIGEMETANSIKAYPVQNATTKELRSKMLNEIKKRYSGNVIPLGRLGQYLYIDMHQAIASAMAEAESVASKVA